MTRSVVNTHAHDWCVAEVMVTDGEALRMVECSCGATDLAPAV